MKLDVLIVSEYNFGQNLMVSAYLKDLGDEYFTTVCAGFEPGPLNPLATLIMKLEGYDLSNCASPYSALDLFEKRRHFDILITVCSKRLDEKCPDFPGQLLRLNWPHSDPDRIAESRIDRIQQTRIMRDSIKADVVNFIDQYKEGRLRVLKESPR